MNPMLVEGVEGIESDMDSYSDNSFFDSFTTTMA